MEVTYDEAAHWRDFEASLRDPTYVSNYNNNNTIISNANSAKTVEGLPFRKSRAAAVAAMVQAQSKNSILNKGSSSSASASASNNNEFSDFAVGNHGLDADDGNGFGDDDDDDDRNGFTNTDDDDNSTIDNKNNAQSSRTFGGTANNDDFGAHEREDNDDDDDVMGGGFLNSSDDDDNTNLTTRGYTSRSSSSATASATAATEVKPPLSAADREQRRLQRENAERDSRQRALARLVQSRVTQQQRQLHTASQRTLNANNNNEEEEDEFALHGTNSTDAGFGGANTSAASTGDQKDDDGEECWRRLMRRAERTMLTPDELASLPLSVQFDVMELQRDLTKRETGRAVYDSLRASAVSAPGQFSTQQISLFLDASKTMADVDKIRAQRVAEQRMQSVGGVAGAVPVAGEAGRALLYGTVDNADLLLTANNNNSNNPQAAANATKASAEPMSYAKRVAVKKLQDAAATTLVGFDHDAIVAGQLKPRFPANAKQGGNPQQQQQQQHWRPGAPQFGGNTNKSNTNNKGGFGDGSGLSRGQKKRAAFRERLLDMVRESNNTDSGNNTNTNATSSTVSAANMSRGDVKDNGAWMTAGDDGDLSTLGGNRSARSTNQTGVMKVEVDRDGAEVKPHRKEVKPLVIEQGSAFTDAVAKNSDAGESGVWDLLQGLGDDSNGDGNTSSGANLRTYDNDDDDDVYGLDRSADKDHDADSEWETEPTVTAPRTRNPVAVMKPELGTTLAVNDANTADANASDEQDVYDNEDEILAQSIILSYQKHVTSQNTPTNNVTNANNAESADDAAGCTGAKDGNSESDGDSEWESSPVFTASVVTTTASPEHSHSSAAHSHSFSSRLKSGEIETITLDDSSDSDFDSRSSSSSSARVKPEPVPVVNNTVTAKAGASATNDDVVALSDSDDSVTVSDAEVALSNIVDALKTEAASVPAVPNATADMSDSDLKVKPLQEDQESQSLSQLLSQSSSSQSQGPPPLSQGLSQLSNDEKRPLELKPLEQSDQLSQVELSQGPPPLSQGTRSQSPKRTDIPKNNTGVSASHVNDAAVRPSVGVTITPTVAVTAALHSAPVPFDSTVASSTSTTLDSEAASAAVADSLNSALAASAASPTADAEFSVAAAASSSHTQWAARASLPFAPESLGEFQSAVWAATAEAAAVARAAATASTTVTDSMIKDVKQLLQIMGVPYIDAAAEAEAQCVVLEQLGLVDGVVTDDSDVFIFGGKRVFRNMFDRKKYVEMYTADGIERDLGLDRGKLLSMAMLLGSDYTPGIKNIGKVNAIEIVSVFPPGPVGLAEFRQWCYSSDSCAKPPTIDAELLPTLSPADRASVLLAYRKDMFKHRHRSARRRWPVPANFPDESILQAYVTPTADRSTEKFSWGSIDAPALSRFLALQLGWEGTAVDRALAPVLEAQRRAGTGAAGDIAQTRLLAYYGPSGKFSNLASKRVIKAVQFLAGDRTTTVAAVQTPQGGVTIGSGITNYADPFTATNKSATASVNTGSSSSSSNVSASVTMADDSDEDDSSKNNARSGSSASASASAAGIAIDDDDEELDSGNPFASLAAGAGHGRSEDDPNRGRGIVTVNDLILRHRADYALRLTPEELAEIAAISSKGKGKGKGKDAKRKSALKATSVNEPAGKRKPRAKKQAAPPVHTASVKSDDNNVADEEEEEEEDEAVVRNVKTNRGRKRTLEDAHDNDDDDDDA